MPIRCSDCALLRTMPFFLLQGIDINIIIRGQ